MEFRLTTQITAFLVPQERPLADGDRGALVGVSRFVAIRSVAALLPTTSF